METVFYTDYSFHDLFSKIILSQNFFSESRFLELISKNDKYKCSILEVLCSTLVKHLIYK